MNCLIHLTGMFKNINYFLTDSAENVLAAYKLRLDPGKDSGTENGFIFHHSKGAPFLKGSKYPC